MNHKKKAERKKSFIYVHMTEEHNKPGEPEAKKKSLRWMEKKSGQYATETKKKIMATSIIHWPRLKQWFYPSIDVNWCE